MKLLLVVVAVCAVWPHSVQPKPSKQVRDVHPYPYEVSSPDGSLTPIQSVLYSYSINNNPFEKNIRHYGQNPAIPNQVRKTYTNFVPTVRTAQVFPFNKEVVQAFPEPQIFTYDAKTYAEDQLDNGDIPLRTAVEQIPIEAEVYSHLRDADDNTDNLQFNRGEVESLPVFPSPYSIGFNDVERNAFVVEAETTGFDQIGNRASVESHPILSYSVDPDDAPGQVQVNSRPFGQLSEQYSGGHIPFDEEETTFVQPYMNTKSSDKKLVCYWGAWSVYRPKPFDFGIADLDPFHCTHLIYSFAGLDDATWSIKSLDPEMDIVQGAYKAAVGLKAKNPDLKVMIAIGGWNEGGKKYSEMASKKERRDAFVASVISFMEEHKWDGLDLDWEYPGASDRGGRFSDKANFASLVSELSAEFKTRGWLLTAAVSPARFRVNEGYDVAKIAEDLDYIFVMTYDLRGSWDGKADHHSPLSSRDTDAWAFKSLNTKDGLNYWNSKGAPMHKLLMGIPFYGRSFTLSSTSNTKPGAQASSGGNEGKYTAERGFLAYYEVCQEMRNGGWAESRDSVGGPYIVKGNQWVGYDDTEYITTKMEAVHSMGLGGAFVWAIDLDDNLGVCGPKWPLINTMRKGLFGSSESPVTPTPIIKPTVTQSTSTTSRPAATPEVSSITGSTPEPEPPTNVDVLIPCQEGSYMRNPTDCSSYFLCVHGAWGSYPCPDGLLWNDGAKRCDWSQNVKCERPTSTPTSTSPTAVSGTVRPTTTTTPTTPTPIPQDVVEPSGQLSGDYMVVCYFTNWAWYRPGIGKYTPDDIDPSVCTHIVYGFAVLDYSNLIIKPHDTWADFDNKFYEKVTALKSQGKKVTIAIGGWNDSAGDKYSRLVNNPSARAKFISHVIEFIKQHNFDGLDLDWEYPVCWQVDCNKGPVSDKEGFSSLVKELSAAFKPEGLLLSAAVSPSKKVIDAGYDAKVLSDYMDWIAVMTYDFHGHWDKKTGHVAPMYDHPEADYDYFNMDYSIKYWHEKGAAMNKLVLGMPLYGQSFSINDPANTGLNSPARSGGQAGQFTRAKGFLAYYEICQNVRQGWTVVQDPEERMGPYAYSGNQWVSYDDVNMIRKKSQYIRDMGLAGGMVWALDLDDFNNRCGQGKSPLMNTIKAVLGPAKSISEVIKDSEIIKDNGSKHEPELPKPMEVIPPKPIVVTPPKGTSSTSPLSTSDGYKVVCYFTNWAWYRRGEGKYTPDDIDPSLCTHIVYGFAVLNNKNHLIKPHDTWADYDNKFYEKVTALKNAPNKPKVLVAIGGWNDSAGDKYSKLVNDPAARARFNAHVIEFIINNNFDGLDLDWEYPVCWQVNCDKGPSSDKEAFAAWVRELHVAFKPHGLLLSAAVSPSNKVIDAGYDVPTVSKYLDWIAVMTYDYHGQWDKKTGHVAPMYAHSEDDNLAFNTNFTIHYWIEKGADPKKLVMGMPMYGQSFSLASAANNGLNQKSYGGGQAGPYTRARGFLGYYEICHNIQNQDWTVIRDPEESMGPYAYRGGQWVGFDDIPMIKYKSEYIKKMGLGGGMIWALDLDDFRNRCGCEPHPLLRTINRVLRGTHGPDPGCATLGGIPPRVEQPPMTGIIVVEPERSTSTCEGGAYKPHPSDCAKFFQCNQNQWEERACFPGLHWNPAPSNRCDWPNQAKCKPGLTPVPAATPPVVPQGTTKPIIVQGTTPTSTTIAPWKTRSTSAPWTPTKYVPWKPTTTPWTIGPPITTPDTGYKVVCYFTNWAWYRKGAGKYTPDDIDAELCTHVVYGFAVLDANRLLIKPHDTWADFDNYFYEKVTRLRARGIKVTMAIGGWNDSLGPKYSKLVNNPAARARFIAHVIEFLQKHNFDGLDLDWEYPKCWQVDCDKGPASDKQGFSAWIRELHTAFQPHGLLLSAAVSPSNKVIDAGYEVPELNKYLDWIAVMTYDYHGHWDKKTGHVAPMYHHAEGPNPAFNANYTMNYWIELGADPKKLIMGMPTYGQAFSLSKPENNGLNAPAKKGQAGEFTRAAGFLAYYEICDRIRNKGYTVVNDPSNSMGPYAVKGNQWVGYDDIAMIKHKSEYIVQNGLGGGMIWALDLDDFRGNCGCGTHPLLRTINQVLRNIPGPPAGCGL